MSTGEATAKYMVRLADGREFGPAAIELIVRWAHEGRVPPEALLIPTDGSPIRSVLTEPSLAWLIQRLNPAAGAAFAPPAQPPAGAPPAQADDAVSAMIPYKNPPALIGYYVSVGSLLPPFGLVAGPIAIVMGVKGLRRRAADPRVRGAAHAWVAIILGVLGTLIGLGCGLTIVAAIIDSAKRGH